MNTLNIILDFDSTIITLEGLDELTRIIAERNNDADLHKKVAEITDLGMSGKLSFSESLSRRAELLSFEKHDLTNLIEHLRKNITRSLMKNFERIQANSENLYVVSGGFVDFVVPVVETLGVPKANVFANKFKFGEAGTFIGVDLDNPMAHDGGKEIVVRALGLKGKTVVVGDGYTDYKIKEAGLADYFIAFTGNKRRENVVKVSDFEATSFDHVLTYIKTLTIDNANYNTAKTFAVSV